MAPNNNGNVGTTSHEGLRIVEENEMTYIGWEKYTHESTAMHMYIGGIRWCLKIAYKGSQYWAAELKPLVWMSSEERLWIEVSFCNQKAEDNWCSMKKVPIIEMVKDRIDRCVISDDRHSSYEGVEISVFVRVLRANPWRPETYFRSSTTPHNLTLDVSGTLFYVDKEHLTRISPVFAAMLNGHFAEKDQEMVKIGEVDPNLFNVFLCAIAPIDRVLPNPQSVMELVQLADRFDVSQLREDCARHLVMCPELPVLDRWTLALRYDMSNVAARLDTQQIKVEIENIAAKMEKAQLLCFLSNLDQAQLVEILKQMKGDQLVQLWEKMERGGSMKMKDEKK